MKKNIAYILLLLTGFVSCRKDDDPIFDQSPDVRINETLQKYEAALIAAADGWKATIIPANGATFHYYFRFNGSNRVFMQADFDTTSAGTAGQSSYRLKALQQPCLIFDTYSYLHLLSDPKGSVNGGEYGQGLRYDFEFAVDTVTTDTVKLTGRFHGSKLVLARATRPEREAWENNSWARALALQHAGKFLTYFTRLDLGTAQYDLVVDHFNRRLTFYSYTTTGSRQPFTTGYQYTADGIMLATPFQAGSQVITAFTDVNWDSNAQQVRLKVNGVSATIGEAIAPVITDLTAPSRWRQAALLSGDYWISETGFTKSKRLDALNLFSIPNYYYMMYFPRFNTTGGITWDFGGIAYVNSNNALSVYGPALMPPVFTADGRIVFSQLGTAGTAPSANAVPIMAGVGTEYAITEGFYFIQVSPAAYDMVSAKDAKTWIRWQALD